MTTVSEPPGGAPPDDEPRDDEPRDDALTFDINTSDGSAHVRLGGVIAASTSIELANLLGGLVRGGHRAITIDFAPLRRTSSVATGVLNRIAADLHAAGGELILMHVPDETVALLDRAGLSRHVQVNPPPELN